MRLWGRRNDGRKWSLRVLQGCVLLGYRGEHSWQDSAWPGQAWAGLGPTKGLRVRDTPGPLLRKCEGHGSRDEEPRDQQPASHTRPCMRRMG